MLARGNPHNPPVIFLHGFLGAKEDWEELMGYLASHFYCLAIDLPGHAYTPLPAHPLDAIKEQISALGKTLPCIGYSMGGRIALQLKEQFSTVIALSAHPGLRTEKEKKQRLEQDAAWAQLLKSTPLELFLHTWYAQPLFNSLVRKQDLFQKMLARRQAHDPHALARTLELLSLSQQALITRFSKEIHFFCGEEDWKYRTLYATIDANVRTIKQCGHAIHLENPAECAHYIREILYAHS